jgi:oxygen-independent coproporphyrinogen-3 oxidase
MLREMGVDRMSFGAQSFHKPELAALERHHDPEDVPQSLAIARAAGFQRLNLDLIYAIPGQTHASWAQSLDAAIALGTTHLSCYGLTYEPNTPMGVQHRRGRIAATEESIELAMLHHARGRLSAAGLPAYEISNYAAPGQECRHNLMYWNGGSYIGLGPSAASHIHGVRWKNRPHLGEWENAIAAGAFPATDVETLTPSQRAGELAMLQLRLSRGLRFDDFEGRTGIDARTHYAGVTQRLAELGLIVVDGDSIRLSDRGLNVADAVAAEFLVQ